MFARTMYNKFSMILNIVRNVVELNHTVFWQKKAVLILKSFLVVVIFDKNTCHFLKTKASA